MADCLRSIETTKAAEKDSYASLRSIASLQVRAEYASAQPVLSEPKDRFFTRLASEIFLSSLQTEFSNNL